MESLIRFQTLSARGADFCFACDQHGRVDMDTMDEHKRSRYLYARALVGLEFAPARIEPLKETLE